MVLCVHEAGLGASHCMFRLTVARGKSWCVATLVAGGELHSRGLGAAGSLPEVPAEGQLTSLHAVSLPPLPLCFCMVSWGFGAVGAQTCSWPPGGPAKPHVGVSPGQRALGRRPFLVGTDLACGGLRLPLPRAGLGWSTTG